VTGNPQDTFRRAGTSATVGRRLEMTVLVRGVDDRCEQTHTPHLDPVGGFVSSRRDRMHGPFPGANAFTDITGQVWEVNGGMYRHDTQPRPK
jgi:hypothetical protein